MDYFSSGPHLLINDDKDKCCCFEADRETSWENYFFHPDVMDCLAGNKLICLQIKCDRGSESSQR